MMPRIIAGFVLLLLADACGTLTLAFQPPTRLARVELKGRAKNTHVPGAVVFLSKGSDEESTRESRLPFLSRALQKLRKKNEGGNTENSAPTEGGSTADEEADLLRAMAEKARLEAEKMDIMLTLAKIDKLEEKKMSPKEHPQSDVQGVLSDTQYLMTKLNAPQKVKNAVPPANGAVVNETSSSVEESLSAGDTLITSDSNQNEQKNVVQEILDGDKPLLSEGKLSDAVDGFQKLPQEIKDMMAKSVGMEDGTNATAVIERLMAEERLYAGEDDDQFSMVAKTDDLESIFVDLEFDEINSFVKSLLPDVTRKEPVKEEYIDALYSEILGKDTFSPKERKAQAVPGGYLIRGENKVKSEGKDDGDVLIKALDKKISESSLAGQIQVHYILDPTPPSGEEIINEEDENPVLLITNYDISPNTQVWVKPVVTFLGLASIAAFALGSFSFNEDVLNRISASGERGDGSEFAWLYDLSLPLALSVLGTQLAHEGGHLMFAVKDGLQLGLPTLVPGFQFGLTGGLTPLRSSPKNIQSLFDVAIAGPLFGLAASLILLYTGLEMTAFMDAASREQLPSMPVEILRCSALGGAMVDYLLGDGALASPNNLSIGDTLKLHPYAIAGFGGLVTNALSLLPIGNTDGGRISIAFFGRSFSRVVQSTAILALVIAGFFGADEANLLLCYAIFAQIFQKEPEIPCRNEVQELDTTRGFIAIGLSLVVLLILTPLP